MSALALISFIFIETLIILFAGTASVFLAREFLIRRRFFLLAGALAFFFTVLAVGAVFLGHTFEVYGQHIAAAALAGFFDELFGISGCFLLLAAVDICFTRGKTVLQFFAAAFSVATIFIGSSTGDRIHFVSGLVFVEPLPQRLVLLLAPTVLASALFVGASLAALLAKNGHSRPHRPSLFILIGSLSIIVSTLAVLFDQDIGSIYAVPAALITYCGFLFFMFFGIAARKHPDKRIEERPFVIVTKSLTLKAALINMAVFWVLTFMLTAVTTSYFGRALYEQKTGSLRQGLQFFAKSHVLFSQQLLGDAIRLSRESSVRSFIRDGMPFDSVAAMEMSGRGEQRITRFVDRQGTVIFSSFAPVERGHILNSDVVAKALAGIGTASIEKDSGFSVWAHRAAAPIRDESGKIIGVAVIATISPFGRMNDVVSFSPSEAAGYGMLSVTGEDIYIVGERVEAVSHPVLSSLPKDEPSFEIKDGDATIIVERVFSTDNATDGFFYVYITPATIASGIFRILAIVSIIILLLLMFMTAVLFYAVSVVLRPVKELRLASLLVEGGDYDVKVTYESPDEIGEQAAAFNLMSQTIRRRTENLQRALREERDFMLSTVRELQTPLNIFRWTLELMRFGDVGQLNKSQLELLEQLHQTNMRLYHFVQGLNDTVRLEGGEISPKPSYFAISDLIDDAAGVEAVEMHRRNISLNWRTPATSIAKVFADKEHVRQVLQAIVNNAVKFSPNDGHIEVVVREVVDAASDGKTAKFVQVSVTDNGRGIPKAVQPRIFERFFRDDAIRRLGIPGAGLGLHIAKKLTELNGGRIWFTSKEGVGSTFNTSFRTERMEN